MCVNSMRCINQPSKQEQAICLGQTYLLGSGVIVSELLSLSVPAPVLSRGVELRIIDTLGETLTSFILLNVWKEERERERESGMR